MVIRVGSSLRGKKRTDKERRAKIALIYINLKDVIIEVKIKTTIE